MIIQRMAGLLHLSIEQSCYLIQCQRKIGSRGKTNQWHTTTTPSTGLSFLFEIADSNVITGLNAFDYVKFQNVLNKF